MRGRRGLLWAGWLALCAAGCAGYSLGPTNGLTAREKSVQVTPFLNQSLQPHLGDEVTQQVRKQLQRDGTYQLVSNGQGDIVVSGVITHYERLVVSLEQSNTLAAQDYRLNLTARVTAVDRRTGKVIFEQTLIGTTLVRVGADLTSAERQGMPLLATDLATRVAALLADGSW